MVRAVFLECQMTTPEEPDGTAEILSFHFLESLIKIHIRKTNMYYYAITIGPVEKVQYSVHTAFCLLLFLMYIMSVHI